MRQIEENSFVRAEEEGTATQQLTKEESQLDEEGCREQANECGHNSFVCFFI